MRNLHFDVNYDLKFYEAKMVNSTKINRRISIQSGGYKSFFMAISVLVLADLVKSNLQIITLFTTTFFHHRFK